MWCKFHQNRSYLNFQGAEGPISGGYMRPVMPIFELIREMKFVNTYGKFHDNRLRNEVCRAVMPFQGGIPLLGGFHVTCDAHFLTRTRDDVCKHVCEFRDNRLRNEGL